MQTEEIFTTSKITRYETWKLTKAADNNDTEISDAPETVEKLKREK